MIRHYAVWDQAAVSGERDGRLVEYLDFLQADVFEHPVAVADGRYRTPSSPGWGLEMKPDFLASHRYPDGPVWSGRPGPKGPAFLA
jgi:L-fuconate dehydratase